MFYITKLLFDKYFIKYKIKLYFYNIIMRYEKKI